MTKTRQALPVTLLLLAIVVPAIAADSRPVAFLRAPTDADWRDIAYLATVPAMTVASDGVPAVIALPATGDVPREVADYLTRYKPTASYFVGPVDGRPDGLPEATKVIEADSAEAAAVTLARTFWTKSDKAVLCRADDYAGACVGAALAAKCRVPLLLTSGKRLSRGVMSVLRSRKVKRVILIGNVTAPAQFKRRKIAVTALPDAKAALAWAKEQELGVTYLAAINPTDRSRTVIKKLSLAGVLLAAGRGGLVVPLGYETQWKVGFTGKPCGKELPKGVPTKKAPAKQGIIDLNGETVPFVMTSDGGRGSNTELRLDLNGNGQYGDKGEGPFVMTDTLTFGGKPYVLTLNRRNGAGGADVHFTWPSGAMVSADLQAHYAALGKLPEHLCIVGFGDAIPQGIVAHDPGKPADLVSDQTYANTDDDLFAEIAVGRIIGENACFATLYAARVLTYASLLDDSWQRNVGEARWENSYGKLFENVGFAKSARHDVTDLKWITKPAEGVRGRRARGFDQDSPLTSVSVLTHMDHSYWKGVGKTFSWDSTALMAPTLVETGGCLTAAIDRETDFRSVISRFLRNGAVGFHGNGREGIAHQEHQRMEFWNAVRAGRTVGQAHRDAQNSMAVRVLETDQINSGPDRYQYFMRGLFGDPAFTMNIPAKHRIAPARQTASRNTVTVYAPGQWWPVQMRVPEDWKAWADKDLYLLRGPGTYALRSWCSEGYDRETTCYNAAIRTTGRIKTIKQVQSPTKPLGWSGKYTTDENPDGTRTYRWRIQLADFDQKTGKITSKVDKLEYKIEWEKQ